MIQNYFFRVLKLIVTKEPGNSDEQKWKKKKKKKKKQMHLWPWNSIIANPILLRWRFAESLVNWNGTIQTLEH